MLSLRNPEEHEYTYEADLEKMRKRYPRDLAQCYIRCLNRFNRISNRESRDRNIARKLLRLMVGTAQPLHKSEICHALIQDDDDIVYKKQNILNPSFPDKIRSVIGVVEFIPVPHAATKTLYFVSFIIRQSTFLSKTPLYWISQSI
jgi:hypothetical protein